MVDRPSGRDAFEPRFVGCRRRNPDRLEVLMMWLRVGRSDRSVERQYQGR
jgi:hypothetical protein